MKQQLDAEIAKNKAAVDAYKEAEARRESLQKEFIDAYAKGLPNSELDEIRSNKRKIIFELQRLESDRDKAIEKFRESVSIPQSERGKVDITYSDPDLRFNANMVFGISIVERYTAKTILPKVIAKKTSDQRAYALLKYIFINETASGSSTVAHEITHITEMQNNGVLQASMDFLKKRAGKEKPRSLKRLTGGDYGRDEKAYKDKWEELGGRVYTGKVYPDATEILTMGIERLDRNPAEIYQSDPEFFEFVIKTLQQL